MSDVKQRSETEIDWQKFCDPESTRYAVGHPCVRGGWKMATDSRIAIAIPTGEPDTIDEFGKPVKFPNVMAILEPALRDEVPWQPLPKFEDCEACDNLGEFAEICEYCRGLKEAKCDMGHYHPCEMCDENGKRTAMCVSQCFVVIGGRQIASKYLARMLMLPNVKWHVENNSPVCAVLFAFGKDDWHGFGAVMPLTAEHDPSFNERKAVTA